MSVSLTGADRYIRVRRANGQITYGGDQGFLQRRLWAGRSVNAAVAAVQLLLGICFFTLQRKKFLYTKLEQKLCKPNIGRKTVCRIRRPGVCAFGVFTKGRLWRTAACTWI